ncbi:hypothetical protein MMC21_000572 [Puttea exsequens]|nr:hypothetical protein [Puttea exsequens]
MCFCFRRRKHRDFPPSYSVPPPDTHYYPPQPIVSIPPPSPAALPPSFTTAITPRSSHHYQPSFPLRAAPACRNCHYIPQYRSTVTPLNPNGNADRPYYVCIPCKQNATAKTSSGPNGKGWITWDDNRGVQPGNPKCRCGFFARQDRAGVNSYAPGRGFWTCCVGACGYVSWRADGLVVKDERDRDGGFVPWLI